MQLFKRIILVVVLTVFGSFSSSYGQNIIDSKFGKGIQVIAKDSSMAVKFGLRFSTLYEGVYKSETKDYVDNILTRRFRLKFDGFILSPTLVYKIEIGASNKDIGGVSEFTNGAARLLLDAVLKWNFHKNFEVWFGQTKLPGNRGRLISSQKLQFVDRSLLNSKFNLDRDIGIQVHHHSRIGKVIVREKISISKGEGRNITTENNKGNDYTIRIEVLPFGIFSKKGDYFESDLVRESNQKLAIGGVFSYNVNAQRSRGQLGTWLDEGRDLQTLFFDAIYKYKGFSAMGEYANRQTKGSAVLLIDDKNNPKQSFYTGKAINGQLAYLFKNNIEIAGRYTTINQDVETQRKDTEQYTLGISKYIVNHNLKAQTDLTLIQTAGLSNVWMFRFQIEVAL